MVVRTFGLDAFFFPVERGPGLLGIVIRHIIAVSSALIALISPTIFIERRAIFLVFPFVGIILLSGIIILFQCWLEFGMVTLFFMAHFLSLTGLYLLVMKFKLLVLVCLMYRHSDSDWDVGVCDDRTMDAFYPFVCVAVYTLVGYSYVYDPTGTYNPTWTVIFD
jgi:Zn-dependent protease with chaperone function